MGPEWLRLVAALACGITCVAGRRRRFAPVAADLFLLGGLLIVCTARSETVSAAWFALSLVTTPLVPCVVAVAGLWWIARRPDGPLLVAGLVVSGAGLAAGLLRTVGLDTGAAGCSACPANPLLVPGLAGSVDALDRLSSLALVLGGALLVAAAAARWWRVSSARRHEQPVLLTIVALGTLTAAGAVHALTLPHGIYDAWQTPVWNAQLVGIVVLTAGCVWRLSLPRRTGDLVARTVLDATPAPADLEASLARGTADPGLVLTFRRPDGSRIDAHGRPTEAPVERSVLRLTRDGTTYAELWYDPRLDPELVGAAAESSGLALEYVAAQARLHAETADAIAARRRVVERADAERGRLERDLHDGAQQSLIALSMHLGTVARVDHPRAQEEITAALHDLRAIARGLFPVTLREAGLLAALRELGDHTAVPLVVEGGFMHPPGTDADTAFYEVVADIAGAPHQPGDVVRVLLSGDEASARIRVTSGPVSPESLSRADDRVASLGGSLSVTSTPDAIVVEGVIPCAS